MWSSVATFVAWAVGKIVVQVRDIADIGCRAVTVTDTRSSISIDTTFELYVP